MLTDSELLQMTEVVRDRLENEELESLGADLGHRVKVAESVSDNDGREGRLACECGWESKWMKAPWFAQHVQAHLEEVVAQRFDVDGNEHG